MRTRAVVVLDLDGPILDVRRRHHRCYTEVLAAEGAQSPDLGLYWERKRQGVQLEEQLRLDGYAKPAGEFLEVWARRIEARGLLLRDELQPGSLRAIAGLRQAGWRLIVSTQRQREDRTRLQLRALGIDQYLDAILISRRGESKADKVRDWLGKHGLAWVWVGDTEADRSAARDLECRSWLVTCGIRSEGILRTLEPEFLTTGLNDPPIGTSLHIHDPFHCRVGGAVGVRGR